MSETFNFNGNEIPLVQRDEYWEWYELVTENCVHFALVDVIEEETLAVGYTFPIDCSNGDRSIRHVWIKPDNSGQEGYLYYLDQNELDQIQKLFNRITDLCAELWERK